MAGTKDKEKTMKAWRQSLARAAFLAAVMTAVPSIGLALEQGPYSMEILVDGAPLAEHFARGTSYVEARENREYSIRLQNHTGRRIAVALSVDGLNSIDAETTTARQASKWILDPYQTITIDGWQTGPETARRFFFTTEDESYGAWLGKTRNLGVIAAAVFREVVPEPTPIVGDARREPAAPQARSKAGGSAEGERLDSAAPPAEESVGKDEDLAATGIGREVGHSVRRVHFRAEPDPAAVLTVRYEYRDALVRLGVLPPPRACRPDPFARRESARGFEDLGFAPDPYR
jgi:hypothetical protein